MGTFRGVPISAGIDYLTCTFKRKFLPERLQLLLDETVRSQHGLGFKIKPWGFCGYSGWCCGGVQCGSRPDGWCIRLSSDVARENWFDVYQESDNITRLDCQVTVRFDSDPSAMVLKHEREVKAFHRRKNPRWGYRWIGSSDGSRTLYLGSRNSDQFMRIYDKEKESKSDCFRGCVRYEMQFNGAASSSAAQGLLGKIAHKDVCVGYCSQFMMDHGVSQQFPASHLSHVCASASHTNIDKQLQWLVVQVRPTVELLRLLGLESKVLKALGLSDTLPGYPIGETPGQKYLN